MEVVAYYDDSFLWGECLEKQITIDGHDLYYRYKLVDDCEKIIQVYECKKCNALLAINFYRGKQFSSYISFPHILFKKYNCGTKVGAVELLKKVSKRFDKRMYTNFKAGLFSGFPLCCVLYFCLLRSIPADPGFYAQIKHIIRKTTYQKYELSGVRCPICEIRNYSVNGKRDSYSGECINASLFNAVKSGMLWRITGEKKKIDYNEWALNQRERE